MKENRTFEVETVQVRSIKYKVLSITGLLKSTDTGQRPRVLGIITRKYKSDTYYRLVMATTKRTLGNALIVWRAS